MAREILFKAKRIDNGEWVEGLLWKKKYQSNKWFISCFPDKDDNEDVYVVDADTICQYTGLTDKNGRKIWENDVVSLKFRDGRIGAEEKEYKYVIRYDEQEASYELEGNLDLLGHPCFIQSNQYMFEVIGNIFDMGKEDFENGC